MTKKLMRVFAALAVFAAFVLPATASATNNPDLTEGVTRVPVGATVVKTATNAEFQTTASATLITCSKATMSGTVTANAGGTVEIEFTTAQFSGTGAVHSDNGLTECTSTFGSGYVTWTNLPLCWASTPVQSTDAFQTTSGSCPSNGKPKYRFGSTTAGECEYEAGTAVTGTFTTNGTQASLTVDNTQAGSGATKIGGGFLCPSSMKLKITYTLETANGTPLTIS